MPCGREGNLESQILTVYLRVVHEFGWVGPPHRLENASRTHGRTTRKLIASDPIYWMREDMKIVN